MHSKERYLVETRVRPARGVLRYLHFGFHIPTFRSSMMIEEKALFKSNCNDVSVLQNTILVSLIFVLYFSTFHRWTTTLIVNKQRITVQLANI